MKQFLRKFIDKVSYFQKNKKQRWMAVLLFSVLGITLPIFSAHALFGISISFLLLKDVVLQFLLLLANVLLAAAAGLLTIVTSPYFINVSFTSNEFVIQGWNIVRNLVNMGFIIILAFIGLGTALRIQEYQWQKTLPRLFIILLLINFTPVICGVIIDASNIAMNYFLDGVTGWGSVLDEFTKQYKEITSSLMGFSAISEILSFSFMFKTIIHIFISLMTAFIYFLFVALFITRYVMLWILVILSPIAFFTYIFKESGLTKKLFPGILHWEEWWNQFLQWNIIGITLAFFLFLSNQLKGYMVDTNVISIGKILAGSSGYLDTIMPYIVCMVLLFIGFLTAIKTTPMGAGGVISGGKKYGNKALGWMRKGGTRVVRERIAAPIERKLKTREIAGSVTRQWEKHNIARWAVPEGLRKYAEHKGSIETAQKELSYRNSGSLAHGLMTEDLSEIRGTAALKQLAKNGDVQDLFDAAKKQYKLSTDDQVIKDKRFKQLITPKLVDANKGGELTPILRNNPRLARLAAGNIGAYEYIEKRDTKTGKMTKRKMTEDEAVEAVARDKVRVEDIKDMGADVFKDKAFVTAFMQYLGKGFYKSMSRNNPQGKENFLETLKEIKNIDVPQKSEQEQKEWQEKILGKFEKVTEDRDLTNEGWKETLGQMDVMEKESEEDIKKTKKRKKLTGWIKKKLQPPEEPRGVTGPREIKPSKKKGKPPRGQGGAGFDS
ncbi:hypothetical protein KAR26_00770 [Candidatus Parcubacteria bacterium]|nr:hypothetical protein [Candidatus Parcubacteria bacterium]